MHLLSNNLNICLDVNGNICRLKGVNLILVQDIIANKRKCSHRGETEVERFRRWIELRCRS